MPSEKPWTSSSALPRNWILTKIMPPDCLAWQPGDVFVCGGFDGYGMTRRNVVYLPIYSRFQSTCHIRGMTLREARQIQDSRISIHMPHTWHDAICMVGMSGRLSISIHMPHTWHDARQTAGPMSISSFQSTCHIRGMTGCSAAEAGGSTFQSTCHIRGMTAAFLCLYSKGGVFQSTCHIRGMTAKSTQTEKALKISIHMPHTWHDFQTASGGTDGHDFNPHATYVA